MTVSRPDYLSRDFEGLRASLLQYAQQVFPEWQPSSEGDIGMVMLELMAYAGDIQSYYTDRAQFENYLSTATQRDSVLAIANLLGYVPNAGAPATGEVTLVTDSGVPATTVPVGTRLATARIEEIDGPLIFETVDPVTVPSNGSATAVVTVVEGSTVEFLKIGESTGAPSQSFLLPHTGVYLDSIQVYVEDGTGTTVINPGGGDIYARQWSRVDHLLDAGGQDLVFEVQYTENAVYILFGDDVNGAIPATGLQVFATYRYGYGAKGNLPSGSIRTVDDTNLPGVKVQRDATTGVYFSNVTSGGADPEDTESIRFNAPRAYRTQRRAVTLDDFKDLALSVEGVHKANVVSNTFTSVTVYITGPDGKAPTTALINRARTQISERAMLGVTVTVSPPVFVAVDVGTSGSPVLVNVDPRYSNAVVQASVDRAIRAYVDSLSFGQPVTAADVYSRTMEVEGVSNVFIPVITRTDTTQSTVVSIYPRPWELFSTGTLHMTVTGGVA